MLKFIHFAASFLAILLLLSCNEPFDPRAPLQEQLVVFSILSTDRTDQMVRVERTYMPSDFDPSSYTADNSVANATVTIIQGNTSYQFRDTSLSRSDTSRFKFPLHAYVLDPFTPEYGKSYLVRVQAPQLGVIVANVAVPAKSFPGISPGGEIVLNSPGAYDDNTDILFSSSVSSTAKGYIGRLFIDYDVLKESSWVSERIEVPLNFFSQDVRDLSLANYPQLTPRTSTGRVAVVYKAGLYRAALNSIAFTRYKTKKLVFKWLVFQFLQADQNLFNYYNIAHAYKDASSIRLDEPMFTNISGGTGIVGAYALDSLVHLLPANFPYDNK